MSLLDLASSFLITLALHATVLLGAVWLAERAGALRHIGWAEFAWRTALFGALLSAALATAVPALRDYAATHRQDAATAQDEGTAPANLRTDSDDGASAPVAMELPPTGARDVEAANNRTAIQVAALNQTAASIVEGRGAPTDPVELPTYIALPMLALWLAGIALGVLHLAGQSLALRRLARAVASRGQAADQNLHRQSHRLAGELGIAPPTLRVSPQAGSPMVLPGARVLLPTWATQLDAAQQRALLAHELCHLQRHDPAWRIAQRLALLPLFFHPLAWRARHRLEALAEDACDARAAQLLGSGRPLAECLATCLTHAGARAGHPALAVAMAGDSGHVLRRVQNLLEESRMSLRPLSPAMRRTALVITLAALVALPGLAVTTFAADGLGDSIQRLTLSTDDTITYRHRENGHQLSLKLVGDVVFNDDGTDISRLGKGARFAVAETRDGVEREVRFFGKGGVIQREYRVDGKLQAIDAAGRAWLATMLPDVMRESGIHAAQRGKALLAKGGPDALLAEIALIESDHAAARYLSVLFGNARLDAAQMQRAITLATDIESDFELRQALQSALEAQALAPAQQVQLLSLSTQISSDFERAELLSSVADTVPLQGEVLDAWRKAVSGISSDFEQRRVIEALLGRGKPSPAAVVVALDAAHGISSDFETRQVLAAAAPRLRTSTQARAAFLRLAATISSDFELRESLKLLLDDGPVDVATADDVLKLLGAIGSDFEAGEVLQSLARVMPADAALIERYRAAARRLDDFERGQAEKALDRFADAG